MKVTQFINSNSGNAANNHFIIVGDNTEVFQSYDSKISELHRDEKGNQVLTIYPDWNYSNTTRKHFYNYLLQTFNIVCKQKDIEKMLENEEIRFESSGYSVKVIEG